MKKRIAYVGVSFPISYDYGHQASRTRNDLYQPPNPIIESPMGLLILYDEIWFLCESLCPENMRKLPYVKFVDQEFPKIYLGDLDKFKESEKHCLLGISDFSWDEFRSIYKSLPEYRLDSHGRSIKVLGHKLSTICNDKNNLLTDMYILKILEEKGMSSIDYVSNRLYTWNDSSNVKNFKKYKEAQLAEELILSDIPNYLSFQGPYHECIEDLRNDKLLVEYRRWIMSDKENIKNKEITELVEEVNKKIEMCKNDVFLKNIDNAKYKLFSSISKTIITTVFSELGFLDIFASIFNDIEEFKEKSSYSWQGFVVRARYNLKAHITE